MPVKFKESQKDRKGNVQNFYMRSTPLEELKAALENNNTPKRKKQKIRNELVKRGHG